ncbi:MAG: hypothetical protein HYZ27_05105, partial [Deltaproteobacteria bacterium]|nr:hypothetical protein [Deltaproteobacteria bacterium]
MKAGALVLGAAALAACDHSLPVAPVAPAQGRISVLDTVGPDGETGWWPSLAFDRNDQPHLSYCDAYHADLRYATRVNGRWQATSAVSEGKVGKYTALAIDSGGQVAIAFYDQDAKYLRYAWATPRGFESERLTWGVEVGMASELRFDEHDTAHLFYYTPSGKLIHASRPKSGGWSYETVAPATGGYSVRISPALLDGRFWVSFVDWSFKDTTLRLARQSEQGFVVETVLARRGPGWRSQIVLAKGKPELLFTLTYQRQLRVAQETDSGWQSARLLRDVGNFAAVAAVNGDIVAAYEDVAGGEGSIKMLKREAGQWKRYQLDPEGPAGAHLAVAVDSRGRP